MRILGLDFGSKTVGVAVTDPLGITAQGVEIIRREKETHMRPTFRRIGELIDYYGVESIVLGLPLNMDDTMGDRAEKTLAFKEELERKFSLPVFLVDERLTTVEADLAMEEAGISRRDFKKYVDMIAAVLILRDYMNSDVHSRPE
ncbi:MAG: Holliday junction resolvase RuvX [Lachnospiraceae bacterium]|nr:Holliday junction resolvase RuvX [Lachnospiraceae bacterium]